MLIGVMAKGSNQLGTSKRASERYSKRVTHRFTSTGSSHPFIRGGKAKRTRRRTTKRTRRTTKRRSTRRRRRGMGRKMTKMDVAQLFRMRGDLREAKKAMDKVTYNATLKVLDGLATDVEQFAALDKLGAPFYVAPKGQVAHTDAKGRSWVCPHHGSCLDRDECDDFEEHKRSKGRD